MRLNIQRIKRCNWSKIKGNAKRSKEKKREGGIDLLITLFIIERLK